MVEEAVAQLMAAIRGCERCPLSAYRTVAVPAHLGEQAQMPLLAIMGEAPGANEDATGRPFVGRAGHVLDGVLEDAGTARSEVLLLNRVRCRPPRNNLASHPEAVTACNDWTVEELNFYDPKVVVLMGATAIKTVFGSTVTVGEVRGQARVTGPDFEYGERVWVPTYHPASLLPHRRPENRPLVVADMLLARELLRATQESSTE